MYRVTRILLLICLILIIPRNGSAMSFTAADRVIFLFGHPDDDAFICGTMRLAITAKADVYAAWATSGDYFGKGREREAELNRAMEILGLSKSRIRLFRIPDLALLRNLEQLANMTTRLFSVVKPNKVFVNAYEGGHPDHDAVNFLAFEAARRTGLDPEIYEFPLYNGTGSFLHWKWRINGFPPGGPPVRFMPLTEDTIQRKYRIMMEAYSTQWLYMIPARLASPAEILKAKGEPYRLCPRNRDFTVPPHQGTLNYERWFNSFMNITFKDFRAAVIRVQRNRPPQD